MMRILKTELRLCPCCWQTHNVHLVQEEEVTVFKGVEVKYDKVSEYCELSDCLNESEELMDKNDLAVKDAYRSKTGLMTSSEIKGLRKKYGLSQVDLCILLGFGQRTITRYESSQVQTLSHDLLLRRLWEDVGWFLELLERNKKLSAYEKYRRKAEELQEEQINTSVVDFIKKYRTSIINNNDLELSKIDKTLKEYHKFMLRK